MGNFLKIPKVDNFDIRTERLQGQKNLFMSILETRCSLLQGEEEEVLHFFHFEKTPWLPITKSWFLTNPMLSPTTWDWDDSFRKLPSWIEYFTNLKDLLLTPVSNQSFLHSKEVNEVHLLGSVFADKLLLLLKNPLTEEQANLLEKMAFNYHIILDCWAAPLLSSLNNGLLLRNRNGIAKIIDLITALYVNLVHPFRKTTSKNNFQLLIRPCDNNKLSYNRDDQIWKSLPQRLSTMLKSSQWIIYKWTLTQDDVEYLSQDWVGRFILSLEKIIIKSCGEEYMTWLEKIHNVKSSSVTLPEDRGVRFLIMIFLTRTADIYYKYLSRVALNLITETDMDTLNTSLNNFVFARKIQFREEVKIFLESLSLYIKVILRLYLVSF